MAKELDISGFEEKQNQPKSAVETAGEGLDWPVVRKMLWMENGHARYGRHATKRDRLYVDADPKTNGDGNANGKGKKVRRQPTLSWWLIARAPYRTIEAFEN